MTALTALLLAVGVAACAGTGSDQMAAPASPEATQNSTTTAPPSSAPTTTARGPLGAGEPVTIAFGGDVSFEGLESALDRDPRGLLSDIAPVLGAADVSMVNLEAALATGGDRAAKTFAFRVGPSALDALAAAGTDVVTMANNHGMDYGASGLQESLAIRDTSEVAVIGVGRDAADAYAPYVTEVRGQRIGIIAANDVFDSNLVSAWTATDGQPGLASAEEPHQERLAQEVRGLRPEVDTLVVYLHFGTEKDTCPHARQQELVDLLVEAGADIIVGSHAHRLQGLGYHGDRFVAYGLSNFVFKAPSEPGRRTGVLTVTATGNRIDGYEWTPAVLRNLVPVPLDGSDADAARAHMDELRVCAGLSTAPSPALPGEA